jgi:MOSC domain-containing protein YiiM
MKISSVNIGKPLKITWRGKEIQTGIYKQPVNHSIFLGAEDVENDHVIDRRYHGGLDKACYLFSEDHYDFWKTRYPNLGCSLRLRCKI